MSRGETKGPSRRRFGVKASALGEGKKIQKHCVSEKYAGKVDGGQSPKGKKKMKIGEADWRGGGGCLRSRERAQKRGEEREGGNTLAANTLGVTTKDGGM